MESRSFIVFQVYYKRGEHDIERCDSEASLRSYLSSYVERYKRYAPFSIDEFETMTLQEMIDAVIEFGEDIIYNENGYGIVNIVDVTGGKVTVHAMQ